MLNDAQRTSLGIVMRMIEEKMRAIESRLAHPEERALTFEVRNDLTPVMVQVLREKIDEVLTLIRAFRDHFALPLEIKLASRDIRIGLTQRWAILQESTSKQLRRYGDVDPSLTHVLDPKVEALARLMVEMDDILRIGTQLQSSGNVKRSGE
jgi:hypothetical protein